MDEKLMEEMRKKRYIQPPNFSGLSNPMKKLR